MNKYENVIIVLPEVDQSEIIKKYSDLINNNGNLINVDDKGKKQLAYEIRKRKEGRYIIFEFESEAEFIAELERQYRIDDNIIKFLVVRRED